MVSPSLPVSSLRAHLLSSLPPLPGFRTFHLHVLASSPRKPAQSLFLYASPRPKCLVQDVLVLLSEEVSASTEQASSIITPSGEGPARNISPRCFVSAIEASVYTFPSSDSTILYISKVDGTGQGAFPSPTSNLLRAFLAFYASPRSPLYTTPTTQHLWVHLFARSQRQYLFPNSADHPEKKPLGDVALCKWWKKILSDVAKAVQDASGVTDANDSHVTASTIPARSIRLYYTLPGQSELEASYLLREAQPSSLSQTDKWIYSHPYNIHAETGLTLPSGPHTKFSSEGSGSLPLAYMIPHFEDDPKSRFLDELEATSEEQAVAVPVPTPKRKRQKVEGSEKSNSTLTHDYSPAIDHTEESGPLAGGGKFQVDTEEADAQTVQLPPPPAIMYNPPSSSPPPAREQSPPLRPSTPDSSTPKRPALLSPHTPNLPTFPTSLLSPHTPTPGSSRTVATLQTPKTPGTPRTPQTPRTPRRPKSDLDTISAAEFWERMSYRQECSQGAVTGFFVAVFSQRYATGREHLTADALHPPRDFKSHIQSLDPTDIQATLLVEGTVPHSVIKRVMSSLLTGVEFSTAERAHKGTQVIETAIEGLCAGLGHVNGELHQSDTATQSKVPEHRIPEVYKTHVYSSLSVSNPPLVRKSADSAGTAATGVAAPVNVLGVRRKKKRE